MTFRQFAVNNVIRNKRLYMAYFLSSLFMVMVFFTFNIFTYHPVLTGGIMESGTGQDASFGMDVAAVMIYIFSFFFVLYSMGAFLKSRKKEFGLLMLQGISTWQIRLLVFLENIIIGFLATIGGILVGLLFAKVILLIAENILVIEESLYFYIPWQAVATTFISFAALFLFISFFISIVVKNHKLIDLIKGDKKSKGEPKASKFLTAVAVILLGSGYVTAFIVEGVHVIMAMIPVIIVVVIGTYFLFTQLSVFVIRKLKNKQSLFWKKTNMLLFSDLAYRMKDNARTFFMVAIISTVAFSAIGTLFGFNHFMTHGLTDTYSFTYAPNEETTEEEIEETLAYVETVLAEGHIETVNKQPLLHFYEFKEIDKKSILITPESQYNELAQLLGYDTVTVAKDEALLAALDVAMGGYDMPDMDEIPLETGEELTVTDTLQSGVFPEIVYYIVADEAYDNLPEPISQDPFYVWQAVDADHDTLVEAGEIISNHLDTYEFQPNDFTMYEVSVMFSPILFIGLFIGIVFFVSAGSFLYFRLYNDLEDDKQKFRAITKLGLSEKELKKVLTRQTAILFFTPIAAALIHGAVALNALSNAFQYDLFLLSATILGIFFTIQVLYFIIVRYFYIKQIKEAVF
ncbi:ABC transporter permease [Salipaludibacillus sp. LMS25]|uniref:ABC transporter permease n=1 Tax=Salipaludibacillus sp. LMS25 TaxID=2924031 RepID=UPI0020D03DF3|nr:ABC transporter permease [Salipaludibacillus sp. LMS25]UTR16424.1 ABC transporter permease [Salipaludibacillus sp. LMS25]